MNQEVKKFENEAFAAEAVEESGCRLNVKVTIKPKAAQKAYQKAVKEVNKQISVPGFRKGRAPDRTVISHYGASVEREWKEILVNDAYRAALDLTEIFPMNRESIEKPRIEQCSQEDGAVVQIAYEHYPLLPTIDFSKIDLPHIPAEKVTDEKIDEVVEEIRKSHADWEDLPDRSLKEGDFADVTIHSLEEDPPRPLVEERRFEVVDKHIAPWLRKLLVGLKPGETIEGTSEVDDAAEERVKKSFIPTKVRITLHRIKKIVKPPIDDALAQKAGTSSLDELSQRIRENFEKEAEEERRRKQIEALERALLQAYPFELPQSLVESEREERIARKIQALKNAHVPDEEIKSQQRAIESEVAHDLDSALRLYFLDKQIVKQGNIALSNAELNDEITRLISQNPYLYGKDQSEEQTRAFISRVASSMLQRKAKDYALSQIGS